MRPRRGGGGRPRVVCAAGRAGTAGCHITSGHVSPGDGRRTTVAMEINEAESRLRAAACVCMRDVCAVTWPGWMAAGCRMVEGGGGGGGGWASRLRFCLINPQPHIRGPRLKNRVPIKASRASRKSSSSNGSCNLSAFILALFLA